jgi:rod shape determining protein RodA
MLILIQPDVGTAVVYMAALAAVLFVVGVRWIHLAAIGTVALVGALAVLWWLPAVGVNVLQQYQTKRITGFTHPGTDPQGVNYNIEQSIIAVGAGGLRGRGVAGATQTRLAYLPANDTDFVFSSFAEQRGFLGASILLMLYLLIVWRGLKIIAGARDLFSAAVAGGLVFAFLFQVFVNVGMAIGIAPITGIPLPFISVGGSSMIANLVAMGILQAIHVRGGRRRG